MQKQRDLNSAFTARRHETKVVPDAPKHDGMYDRSKLDHPLLPGAKRPLDDTPLQKTWDGKGAAPVHPSMEKGNDLGKHDITRGNAVLNDAARLGGPTK